MMNLKKTGDFLKRLRKEKDLTQEQLAEKFNISSRTVSRWENGSNMPDVSILIELADFYDVDIREIIDGERKSETMDNESNDTLRKVADYATKKETETSLKVVYAALGIAVILFLSTILFACEFTGLLYGIIPAEICELILVLVYGIALCLLFFYLRVRCWVEKPAKEAEKKVCATVISKEVKSGTHETGRSVMGYSFAVTFQTEDDQILELFTYEIEYGGLKIGTKGILTYRGRYFVDFK